ncbi:hypothetical protein BSKO_12957 [Bryopsis sp. KO-2023]|nr:hypothetical protein BSKO_12957 [Bryopsis sp. KO-2023]
MLHSPVLPPRSSRRGDFPQFGSLTSALLISKLASYSSDDEYYRSDVLEEGERGASNANTSVSGRGVTSRQQASGGQVHFSNKQFQQLKKIGVCFWDGPTSGILTRVLWLYVLHSFAPRQTRRFEWASIAVASTVSVCSKIVGNEVTKVLPGPLPAALGFVKSFAIPAGIMLGWRIMSFIAGRGKSHRRTTVDRNAVEAPGNNTRRRSSFAAGTSPAVMVKACRDRQPELARDFVDIFEPSLSKLEGMVNWEHLKRTPRMICRFDDTHCELMRFAAQNGLHEAASEAAVEEALEKTADRIRDSTEWCKTYSYIEDEELKSEWGNLLVWTTRMPSGHPAILIRLGQSLRECSKKKLEKLGPAAVTQVDRGVRKLLKNDAVDQMVVVLDCQDAPALQVTQMCKVLKSISSKLNKHYPGRLKSMYLVHVPRLLRWVIQAVMPFIHPATRKKLIVVGGKNEALPAEISKVINWGLGSTGRTKGAIRNGAVTRTNGEIDGSSSEGSTSAMASPVRGASDMMASTSESDSLEAISPPSVIPSNPSLSSRRERSCGEMPITTLLLMILSCILTLAILNGMKDGMEDLKTDNEHLQRYLKDDM